MEQKDNNHEKANSKKSDKKLMSILAYIGILILIPFLTSKDDPTVKFHIKQGLVLICAGVAVWLIGYILPIWIILQLLNIGIFVLAVIGIVNVVNDKKEELPLVGQFAKHFKF
jgi:uncharacterized membrane protein